jgi:hypothetical protein
LLRFYFINNSLLEDISLLIKNKVVKIRTTLDINKVLIIYNKTIILYKFIQDSVKITKTIL